MAADQLSLWTPFEAKIYDSSEGHLVGTTIYQDDHLNKLLPKDVQEWLTEQTVQVENIKYLAIFPTDIFQSKTLLKKSSEKGRIGTIRGLTKDPNFESMTSVEIPLTLPKGDDEESLKNLFDESEKSFKHIMDDFANKFDINILINDDISVDSHNVVFKLSGTKSNITMSKHQMMALIDLLTNSFNNNEQFIIDYVDIYSSSLIPHLLDTQNMNFIKRHLLTDVHIPSINSEGTNSSTQLILTGNVHSLLLKTKHVVQQIVKTLKDNIYYRKLSNLSVGKVQFLKNFYSKEIEAFMIKYHCFVKLNESSIEFQSASPILLNNTIKQFTLLFLQEIIELTVFLNSVESYDSLIHSLVEGEYFKSKFTILAVNSIKDKFILCVKHMDLLKDITAENSKSWMTEYDSEIRQLKVSFEINMEYEDFISGKKNGKLTRIIENSNSLIELTNNSKTSSTDHDDATINVSIISDSLDDFQISYSNLIKELPAEEAFFIPEVYHRPIIGSGGAIVQTIMRKHNVFIQFSNSFSLPQNKLVIIRYDNVVIRCPTKNKQNIKFARDEILKLVDDFSYLQMSKYLNLTNNRFENIVLSNDNINLQKLIQIEKNYNVFIDFPDDLSRSDNEPVLLKINGNEDSSTIEAMNEITNDRSLWIKELVLKLSSNFRQFIQDKSNFAKIYNEVITPVEQIFDNVFISFSNDNSEISISFNDINNENNRETLNKVVEFVINYLIEQRITVIDKYEVSDLVKE